MRVLLIKTSSMGDIIHTLPALTDAGLAIPGIQFDWLVEGAFASIPGWHNKVDKVIPVALRRWRKNIFSSVTHLEWRALREQLRDQHYDIILDAQGLVKSAFLAFFTSGKRSGLDWSSARESLASLTYQHKHKVNFYQHAVLRMRRLFSLALDYAMPETPPDFGLKIKQFQPQTLSNEKYIVFLYGTTWKSKQWPETYWSQLANLAGQAGYKIKISGNDAVEFACANRIAAESEVVEILPRLTISEMGNLLANAKAAVAVDTGFGHLASALDLPTVSIYGSTNPDYTSALGKRAISLAADFPCSPCLDRECKFKGESSVKPACYSTVNPLRVWSTLVGLLDSSVVPRLDRGI